MKVKKDQLFTDHEKAVIAIWTEDSVEFRILKKYLENAYNAAMKIGFASGDMETLQYYRGQAALAEKIVSDFKRIAKLVRDKKNKEAKSGGQGQNL